MLKAATATIPPTIIRITLGSILKAPNLEPKNTPIIITTSNSIVKLKLLTKIIGF